MSSLALDSPNTLAGLHWGADPEKCRPSLPVPATTRQGSDGPDETVTKGTTSSLISKYCYVAHLIVGSLHIYKKKINAPLYSLPPSTGYGTLCLCVCVSVCLSVCLSVAAILLPDYFPNTSTAS